MFLIITAHAVHEGCKYKMREMMHCHSFLGGISLALKVWVVMSLNVATLALLIWHFLARNV
jgi:hypothetical protein